MSRTFYSRVMSVWTVGFLVLYSLSYSVLSFRFIHGRIEHCPKVEFMCENLSELYLNCSSTKSCGKDLKLGTSVQHCIEKNHICDGQVHCPDGSDEKYCPYVFDFTPEMDNRTDFHRFVSGVCENDYVLCKTGRAKRPISSKSDGCFTKSFICDGDEDCEDGSDEKYCPYDFGFSLERETYVDSYPLVACGNNTDRLFCEDPFRSGQCVKKIFICDGEEDCRNGLDERYCPHDFNFSHPVPTRLLPPPEDDNPKTTEQVSQETPTTKPSFFPDTSRGTRMESLMHENTLALQKVADAVKQLELAVQRSECHSSPAEGNPVAR